MASFITSPLAATWSDDASSTSTIPPPTPLPYPERIHRRTTTGRTLHRPSPASSVSPFSWDQPHPFCGDKDLLSEHRRYVRAHTHQPRAPLPNFIRPSRPAHQAGASHPSSWTQTAPSPTFSRGSSTTLVSASTAPEESDEEPIIMHGIRLDMPLPSSRRRAERLAPPVGRSAIELDFEEAEHWRVFGRRTDGNVDLEMGMKRRREGHMVKGLCWGTLLGLILLCVLVPVLGKYGEVN